MASPMGHSGVFTGDWLPVFVHGSEIVYPSLGLEATEERLSVLQLDFLWRGRCIHT